MIGTGAGALTNLPELGTLVRTLGGITGAVSGGAQIIGGIAATATGAGAAVGIPMILKGAVEVVVSTQVLAATMQEDEAKNANPQVGIGSESEEPNRSDPNDDDDDSIPEEAYNVTEQVKKNNGTPPPGYKGGRRYNNIPTREDAQKLPEGVEYREYDIYPYQKGTRRGTERVVIGSDGSVWYTNDHYFTFKQME